MLTEKLQRDKIVDKGEKNISPISVCAVNRAQNGGKDKKEGGRL